MVSLAQIAETFSGTLQLDAEITGITSSSAAATAGMAFVALPGLRVHGATYAQAALDAGAVAIVTDPEGYRIINRSNVPILVVDNVAEMLGPFAAFVYGNHEEPLTVFGITGTNGKTTTSFLLRHILQNAGRRTGLIGGVELSVAGETTPAVLTTPMADEVQRLICKHREGGGTDLVMEVTSHALVQHRVAGTLFAVSGFTNLTQDHLDYHHDFADYYAAKAQLFTRKYSDAAVILVDDAWGKQLYTDANEAMSNVFALSFDGELPPGAKGWRARAILAEQAFELTNDAGATTRFTVTLPGEFNLKNAALAVCMALVGGVSLSDIHRTITTEVPGRMQVISEKPRVIVDFAHNAAALQSAITSLSHSSLGKLIVVSGSAGDRDADKRGEMGRIAASLADELIITDDDPHGEPPEQIRQALLKGAQGERARTREIADRTEAITTAIVEADLEDTVFIAGRGHETIQEVGTEQRLLDDREVARAALLQRNR